MKTNLNIMLHLFCCEMFPVKTLSSVWCDLKVKMKREKKKSHIKTYQPPQDQHNPTQPPSRSAQSKPATHQISARLACHHQISSKPGPNHQISTTSRDPWPQQPNQHLQLLDRCFPATIDAPCHNWSLLATNRSFATTIHQNPTTMNQALVTTFVSKRGEGWGVGVSQHVQMGAGGVQVSQFVKCFTKFFQVKCFTKFYRGLYGQL